MCIIHLLLMQRHHHRRCQRSLNVEQLIFSIRSMIPFCSPHIKKKARNDFPLCSDDNNSVLTAEINGNERNFFFFFCEMELREREKRNLWFDFVQLLLFLRHDNCLISSSFLSQRWWFSTSIVNPQFHTHTRQRIIQIGKEEEEAINDLFLSL